MTAEQVIRQHRDLPLRESVGPIAAALADESVLVAIEGSVPEPPAPLMLRVGADKQGRLWAFAYTSEATFADAFPQGSDCAAIRFVRLIEIIHSNDQLTGVFLNSASDTAYPVSKELFGEVEHALRQCGHVLKIDRESDPGLPWLQDELRSEHDNLHKEALAIVFPLLAMHGKPVEKLTAANESDLRRGISMFDRVLQINPRSWQAMWLVGKAYQRLREFAPALEWFSRAHGIAPANADVSREAAITAMELGRPADAIPFCLQAIEAKPDDPGLRANLALAKLFSGNAAEAARLAQDALRRDPSDPITRYIVDVCQEVLVGQRPCPAHIRDMKSQSAS